MFCPEELTKLKIRLDTFRPLSRAEVIQLEKNVRIEHVWSSAALEGNTLSRSETASIVESGLGATIHGKTIRVTLEILDLNEAYSYMQDLADRKQPLTLKLIRDLNRLVTLQSASEKSEAGVFRQIEGSS
ncbi:hypothetical protein [Xylocopilactobacillus apicola]|uniref:Uncharacterized protein n=1 Tax=Xylocopilactobacillus apicola TaxID=2932184 RepID=A0AAU9DHV1_9LACO|nr:hypothetical protein [Xylocopilactobacillus apicola]BDR59625.1 hypothetical protein XA3_20660 [Xylocopilactobacillus apicola]